MYGTKTLLVVAAIGGFGLLLVAAALAGQFPWVRLVALLAGLTLMWSSLACGPMIYKRMAGSQVKYPRWLPPGFRPVPSRLSEARLYASTAFGQKWRAATQVAGWLHQDQAAMLCHLAKLAPEGPIVEIGSFRGKSTVFLASGMKDSNRVFAIDPQFHRGALAARIFSMQPATGGTATPMG